MQHNSGSLKQTNKTHKFGRHKSKGMIAKKSKGKVTKLKHSKKSKGNMSRLERKNCLSQLRKSKREEILNKKRSVGTDAPHIISIIPLARDVNSSDILDLLLKCDPQSIISEPSNGLYSLNSARLKCHFNFIIPDSNSANSILDSTMISDTCLFVLSAENGIDSMGNSFYEQIYASHLPAALFLVKGLDGPRKSQLKTEYQRLIDSKYADAKLYNIDSCSDGLTILHRISQHKLKEMPYCKIRPYMLVDKFDFSENSQDTSIGTLKICGYLRGKPLNVNQLVSLPTIGTFQIQEIDILKTELINKDNKLQKKEEWKCLFLSNAPDAKIMEIGEDRVDTTSVNNENSIIEKISVNDGLVRKKVPKGTSEYQAAWIVDSESENNSEKDDEELTDDSENDDEEDDDADDTDASSEKTNDNEMEDGGDEEMMMDNESQNETQTNGDDMVDDYESFKKLKNTEIDMKFPDEVDTPQDIPARLRFKKYRGLKSFRSSPWDPSENLPEDYSKIFKFDNIKKSLNKALKEETDGAEPGWYVMIHLKNVPKANLELGLSAHPLTMFGLLKHENKMSILNLLLKRTSSHNSAIMSKDKLIFHIGARRFTAAPIYSQHTNGDKHKFERYMPENDTFVATIYAPITYLPASVLAYKQLDDGTSVLVASGSILSIDPDRVIIKRIILTGHPSKVLKRNAVVRYMFFNPEDVNWFKPVELRTKMGRIGHIKETLGTHGHMKCQFNDSVKCQDAVMMYLYKRAFPKWTYEDKFNHLISTTNHNNEH